MASSPDPRETLLARLNALRAGYLADLPAKLAAIEAAWTAARTGGRDELLALRALAHNLAGSGAVFGYRDLSIAAAAVEAQLDHLLAARPRAAVDVRPVAPRVTALLEIGRRYASTRASAADTTSTGIDPSAPASA